ncbi:LysR family transcriptional regulator [Trinickia symbiotica]|uniref:LysR family transcriptional regulator n=1 Tax=Trinickia symbiotica TaxID=863227 RepID=A0A2N7WT92_9BURK|nr:LysR family transcriptional regulator [Trinickia symbiotica]PMS32696.1 LysR family transcriptional regulator [Trinickia symbiotica]
MFNRLEALKVFCIAAETLQFRDAASRLATSPQAVTRLIGRLEEELGEVLFLRNTRQMRLSAFAEQLLPQARQLVEDSERLFTPSQEPRDDEVKGVVRVTLPDFPVMREVLCDVLASTADYDQLTLDWRPTLARLDVVEEQIDIGVRVGPPPDSRLVVRRVADTRDRIVASPTLISKTGIPRDLDDLQKRFPLCVLQNANTGRPWPWYFRQDLHFQPANPRFIAGDVYSQLEATCAGRVFGLIQEAVCFRYISSGELVEVLPEVERTRWPVYVYRPQRTVTQPRVKKVFQLLVNSLQRHLPAG